MPRGQFTLLRRGRLPSALENQGPFSSHVGEIGCWTNRELQHCISCLNYHDSGVSDQINFYGQDDKI
ncbi:hypothetical protein POX_e06230 [Penicillium oxalicum]|uniref:Uncharacterized protein n=1 Tax=Penicillium oxalicum (strain 114-2 / CGMCC 5302) TaxID=933388 RepID=S7ZAK8_PENO1|nr:hypothetical protein POX_e06230 [Penicillium oxalicum]EPS27254.1 hypothetical protein PDE_02197 [Penicillium oxalicum 114-2]KAI2788217.1 hypothetical protein POX_e06230 [Penicillium oxalicum]